jgi:HK97 family phage major capsid protein
MSIGAQIFDEFTSTEARITAKSIVAELSEKEKRAYLISRAVRDLLNGPGARSGIEWEVSAHIARNLGREGGHPNALFTHRDLIFGKRDMTVATAAQGGYLVGTDLGPEIAARRARPVVEQLGATRMSGLTANVALVKVNTGASTQWLQTEATQAIEGNLVLGVVVLAPKSVASFVEVSRQLLLQSAADQVLQRDLRDAINAAIDQAAISGSGASGQPLGLANTVGVNAVSGTSLAYGGVLDFIVNAGTANGECTGFAATPAIYKLLANRERFSGGGRGIIDDGTIDGRPVRHSTAVPSASLIGGDWSEVVVGEWGDLEIQYDKFTKFQQALVGLRVISSIDVGVRYPAAFSVASSIT